MTVLEVIQELQKYPENMKVVISGRTNTKASGVFNKEETFSDYSIDENGDNSFTEDVVVIF